MKILFMADVAQNPNSGAAGTEYQTMKALEALGHEVEAVWGDDLPSKISHGNLHYLLELPRLYEKQMLKRLKAKSFDVIHVNQPHGYRAAKMLRRLNRNSVFIHRSHGIEMRFEQELLPWHRKYSVDTRSAPRKLASNVMTRALSYNSRCIARFADGHIVSATQCKDFLSETWHVPKERIAVIPQAAPALFLEDVAPAMTGERLKRVLYVSQYAFFKAPVIVAKVISRLAEANEELHFTWVCALEHHEEIQRLLEPRARNRVQFLDWMSQDELIKVYDRHGLFLFPSFVEGFGKVFLEAMSRGLCVIAADNSGARDVISHSFTGMLAPTGSVETMVTHCLNLIESPALSSALSKAAAECAQNYTWKRVADETVAFYRERLGTKVEELQRHGLAESLLTARL